MIDLKYNHNSGMIELSIEGIETGLTLKELIEFKAKIEIEITTALLDSNRISALENYNLETDSNHETEL